MITKAIISSLITTGTGTGRTIQYDTQLYIQPFDLRSNSLGDHLLKVLRFTNVWYYIYLFHLFFEDERWNNYILLFNRWNADKCAIYMCIFTYTIHINAMIQNYKSNFRIDNIFMFLLVSFLFFEIEREFQYFHKWNELIKWKWNRRSYFMFIIFIFQPFELEQKKCEIEY